MNFLNKMERKIGKYAIPNLMIYLIAAYCIGFVIYTVLSGAIRPNRAAAGRPENGGIRGGDQLHRPRLPGADRAGVHDHCGLPRPGGAHHHYR